jgi:hypothetical protein
MRGPCNCVQHADPDPLRTTRKAKEGNSAQTRSNDLPIDGDFPSLGPFGEFPGRAAKAENAGSILVAHSRAAGSD